MDLVGHVRRLLRGWRGAPPDAAPPAGADADFDVLITHNEVNRRHGTGILLEHLFGTGQTIASIRSVNTYGGEQTFGMARFRLPRMGLAREDIFLQVATWLAGRKAPRRVISVPFCPDELLAAIAVREMYHAPLAIYLMDDHNIYDPVIPDGIMQEALGKAALRLAISPEMQRAYEAKFGLKFWVLPPLVAAPLVRAEPAPYGGTADGAEGVLVGNVWFQGLLEALRKAVRDAGLRIDWYCNLDGPGGLRFNPGALARDGIRFHPPLDEAGLAAVLPRYRFAIVPSGAPDRGRAAHAIAQLSLPSRLAFLVAAGTLPAIVTGGGDGAAAAFVRRFDVGVTCDYSGADLRRAAAGIAARETVMRRNAARLAPQLSAAGADAWFWEAMAAGRPEDLRFERLFE